MDQAIQGDMGVKMFFIEKGELLPCSDASAGLHISDPQKIGTEERVDVGCRSCYQHYGY